jgi:hypothetical protein
MSSPIYQNMVNLIVSLSIRRHRGKFIVLLTDRFLDVAKFITLTPLSLLISCKLSFPVVGLKMSSLPTLALKPPNNISYGILGIYRRPVLVVHRNCPSSHQFHHLLVREHSERWYHTSDLLVLCMTSYH